MRWRSFSSSPLACSKVSRTPSTLRATSWPSWTFSRANSSRSSAWPGKRGPRVETLRVICRSRVRRSSEISRTVVSAATEGWVAGSLPSAIQVVRLSYSASTASRRSSASSRDSENPATCSAVTLRHSDRVIDWRPLDSTNSWMSRSLCSSSTRWAATWPSSHSEVSRVRSTRRSRTKPTYASATASATSAARWGSASVMVMVKIWLLGSEPISVDCIRRESAARCISAGVRTSPDFSSTRAPAQLSSRSSPSSSTTTEATALLERISDWVL